MSCKCEASINDLVVMVGYLLRQQVVLNAKELAKLRGAVISETQGKQILHQATKRYSEKNCKNYQIWLRSLSVALFFLLTAVQCCDII